MSERTSPLAGRPFCCPMSALCTTEVTSTSTAEVSCADALMSSTARLARACWRASSATTICSLGCVPATTDERSRSASEAGAVAKASDAADGPAAAAGASGRSTRRSLPPAPDPGSVSNSPVEMPRSAAARATAGEISRRRPRSASTAEPTAPLTGVADRSGVAIPLNLRGRTRPLSRSIPSRARESGRDPRSFLTDRTRRPRARVTGPRAQTRTMPWCAMRRRAR